MAALNVTYSALLLFTGILCFVVAMLVTAQRRPWAPGSVPLIVLLLALSWWCTTYSIFWAGIPGPTPFFWLDLTYFGVVLTPTAFLVFALQVSGLGRWLNRPVYLALCIEPLLVLVLLWSDPWHGLFYGGMRMENTSMILSGGPMFWANVAYSYLLMLAALVVLVRRLFMVTGLYRRQLVVAAAGMCFVWLTSITFVLGFSPLPGADNTPFSFAVAAFAFAYALLRYRLFDISPVARDVLIEQMTDGVVVLDAQNRIVDLNTHARNTLPVKPHLGQPAEKVFADWFDVTDASRSLAVKRAEVMIDAATQTFLDVQITPLFDRRRHLVGRLVVWRNISPFKRIQTELEVMATHDSLTRVYNRRYFFQLAEEALKQAAATGKPLFVIMIDIDFFKAINDQFGHLAGDQVLLQFAQRTHIAVRTTDVFARFGGEEFVVLLPDTALHEAIARAEDARAQIEATSFQLEEGASLHITMSLGIAGWQGGDDTLLALLRRADAALYLAKQGGRNRVFVEA